MNTPPFSLEVNLDDAEELELFLGQFEPARGRRLANLLGFKGRHSVRAANGLINYAQNKRSANACRNMMARHMAEDYEAICDRIYKEDIQPFINCW